MNDVTKLASLAHEPVQPVIDLLEKYLEEAKAGKIRAALVAVDTQGEHTGGAIRWDRAGDFSIPDMAFACEVHKLDLIAGSRLPNV